MNFNDKIEISQDEPLILTERQKWLCSHLDILNRIQQFCPNATPSNLFRGALYITKNSNKQANPDWMAQAAHSLREIMYGTGFLKKPRNKFILFFSVFLGKNSNVQTRREHIKNIIKVYQEEKRASELAEILNDLHFIFTNIAHHFQDGPKRTDVRKKITKLGLTVPNSNQYITDSIFNQLIEILENAWTQSIPRQLTVHEKVDSVLSRYPSTGDENFLDILLSFNPDARQYFFFKADERWLDWLWGNGFLDVIKEKPKNSSSYGYRTPEINYLVEMAKRVPEKVTQIILNKDTATTRDKFNPELIDQFLRMCDELPVSQLAQIIPKIHEQKWVRSMSKFSHWGFEYERMFKVLSESKDYKSLLLLAETVLDVRSKDDLEKTSFGFSTDNPFFFNDLSYTKVFEYLANIPDKYTEEALDLAVRTMTQIVLLGGKSEKEDAFPVQEAYYLFDVDFFSIKLSQKNRLSSRDDVRELAAVIKILVDKLIGSRCDESDNVKKLYNKYVESLPKSRAMWRLRLYVLSLCPEAFKKELKEAFFKLFDESVKNYTDIISGIEYEGALERGFQILLETDKREYVKKVIEYFKKRAIKDPDQNWHMNYGSDILSMIINSLTDEEKKQITGAGFKLNPNHKPEPSIIGPTFASAVQPQAPITQEEFGKFSIDEIVEKLKDEWSPIKLKNKYETSDDFHKPHNAEGVGNQIQANIPKRLQDYINKATLFFEKDVLEEHYLYSFFRGVEGVIKNNRDLATKTNWDGFIKLCFTIKASGEEKPLYDEKEDRDSFNGWLAGWRSVHSAMTDVLQILLREENDKTAIDFSKYRYNLFEIIKYLLKYPDPTPENEKPETASMTSGGPNNQQLVSDPFTMAINSVRGRAFQVLELFIFPDGRQPDNKNKVIIKDDVKKLYENVLEKENTRALMFMFGHYLPQFYFRDIKWMQSLLPKIFPKDPEKKYLYLAAWEGYLANNLYKEIFVDPHFQELYKYALSIDIDDAGRKYFRDPDDGIAIHLALAFVYYEEFDFDHPLFKAFWEKKDSELQTHFVSFIGRSFISGDNVAVNEFLKNEPVGKKRIKEFWDWLLANHDDPKTFTAFGFWISTEKSIFDSKWLAEHLRKTFEKSKGAIDWDYGLTKSVVELSKIAPRDMVSVARLHFLEGQVRNPDKQFPFRVESEWIEAFKILYSNPDTKEEIYTLIDDLIREGGGSFWILKSILEEGSAQVNSKK